ncbi:hypothetical protein DFJ77DRAFT_338406 [Powellomyces hirtus]|nr:hypothetical protein DFJ77DRAFT_338406 [Powellomyces hirtus]
MTLPQRFVPRQCLLLAVTCTLGLVPSSLIGKIGLSSPYHSLIDPGVSKYRQLEPSLQHTRWFMLHFPDHLAASRCSHKGMDHIKTASSALTPEETLGLNIGRLRSDLHELKAVHDELLESFNSKLKHISFINPLQLRILHGKGYNWSTSRLDTLKRDLVGSLQVSGWRVQQLEFECSCLIEILSATITVEWPEYLLPILGTENNHEEKATMASGQDQSD